MKAVLAWQAFHIPPPPMCFVFPSQNYVSDNFKIFCLDIIYAQYLILKSTRSLYGLPSFY